MKPPVSSLKPELIKEAKLAAEKFAAVELKPDIVRLRLYEAAKKGENVLRLKLPDSCSFDMRNTAAASELVTWCAENSLRLIWESRSVDTSDGRRATVWEPEISW